MVKRKCIKGECKEEADYCQEHFLELKRKLSNRNYTLLVSALGLLYLFLLVWYPLKIVDDLYGLVFNGGIFIIVVLYFIIREWIEKP